MVERDLRAGRAPVSVARAATRFDPLVVSVLRSPFHWLLSFGLMRITVLVSSAATKQGSAV